MLKIQPRIGEEVPFLIQAMVKFPKSVLFRSDFW